MEFFSASDSHVTLSEIFFWIVIWSETLTFHLKQKRQIKRSQFNMVMRRRVPTNGIAPFSAYKYTHIVHSSSSHSDGGLTLKTSVF